MIGHDQGRAGSRNIMQPLNPYILCNIGAGAFQNVGARHWGKRARQRQGFVIAQRKFKGSINTPDRSIVCRQPGRAFTDQGINDAFHRHCDRTFSQSTKYGSMQRISASSMLKSKIRKNRRRTIVISCVARESIQDLCNTAMTGFDVGAGLNRQWISTQNFDAVDLPTVGGIDHRIA
jgi:hypothetical protein